MFVLSTPVSHTDQLLYKMFYEYSDFFRDDILATDPPDRCGFIKAKPAAVHTLRWRMITGIEVIKLLTERTTINNFSSFQQHLYVVQRFFIHRAAAPQIARNSWCFTPHNHIHCRQQMR